MAPKPVMERISKFKARQPGVRLVPPMTSMSGLWESTERGEDTRHWIDGTSMMRYLDKKYPPARP